MAKVIKLAVRHSCFDELDALGDLWVDSVAECSCAKQYIRRETQRDGRYWEYRNTLGPAGGHR
jgi:hypothetical protein